MAKTAIVVLADTETMGDLGREVKALTSAKEFKEAGDETTIIFDGAGTKWIGELSNPEHEYHQAFNELKEQIAGACSYCSAAFGAKEDVEASEVPLLDEHEGHPSLQKLVSQDYQVITF